MLNPNQKRYLQVRWSKNKGFYVENLFVAECECVDDLMAVLEEGQLSHSSVCYHTVHSPISQLSLLSHSSLTNLTAQSVITQFTQLSHSSVCYHTVHSTISQLSLLSHSSLNNLAAQSVITQFTQLSHRSSYYTAHSDIFLRPNQTSNSLIRYPTAHSFIFTAHTVMPYLVRLSHNLIRYLTANSVISQLIQLSPISFRYLNVHSVTSHLIRHLTA